MREPAFSGRICACLTFYNSINIVPSPARTSFKSRVLVCTSIWPDGMAGRIGGGDTTEVLPMGFAPPSCFRLLPFSFFPRMEQSRLLT